MNRNVDHVGTYRMSWHLPSREPSSTGRCRFQRFGPTNATSTSLPGISSCHDRNGDRCAGHSYNRWRMTTRQESQRSMYKFNICCRLTHRMTTSHWDCKRVAKGRKYSKVKAKPEKVLYSKMFEIEVKLAFCENIFRSVEKVKSENWAGKRYSRWISEVMLGFWVSKQFGTGNVTFSSLAALTLATTNFVLSNRSLMKF